MGKRTKTIENALIKKFREMPPEQAFQMMCLLAVGIGQFAASRSGDHTYYARLIGDYTKAMQGSAKDLGSSLMPEWYNELGRVATDPVGKGREHGKEIGEWLKGRF